MDIAGRQSKIKNDPKSRSGAGAGAAGGPLEPFRRPRGGQRPPGGNLKSFVAPSWRAFFGIRVARKTGAAVAGTLSCRQSMTRSTATNSSRSRAALPGTSPAAALLLSLLVDKDARAADRPGFQEAGDDGSSLARNHHSNPTITATAASNAQASLMTIDRVTSYDSAEDA